MNIEFDVTLQCNFSCVNCNRHSNFNNLVDPTDKTKSVGLNLYENTDVDLDRVRNFIESVKTNPNIQRLHIIGGEPTTHPKLNKIVDLIRPELYGKHIPNVLIISNIHPKMLKAGILDTPEELIRYFPFGPDFHKINLENIAWFSRITLQELQKHLTEVNPDKEELIRNIDNMAINIPYNQKVVQTALRGLLIESKFFHGIPLVNYKPLSKKAEEHRCTLVAPYDSGQKMLEKCNIPNHCGINFAFDGYWPCSQGAAIARLFKLDKYKRTELPKNFNEWKDVDENGVATINPKSDMWDLCKLCQLSAEVQMNEKDFGRPISLSYRKALGMEKSDQKLAEYVVPSHSKKLADTPDFRHCDDHKD